MTFGLSHSIFGKPVPLQNVAIKAYVVDMIAEVKIAQTYKNSETCSINAIYKFPINESAAVCAFEAEIEGKRKVHGIVKETQEATTEYNNAIEEGHGAFLLEEHHADIFECSVGNILPNQTVVIRITYVTELKHDSEIEKIRFVLPTVIAPKYGIERNIPYQEVYYAPEFTKYELSLLVECKMTSVITNIESPTHLISCEVNINDNPKISRITLGGQISYLDKDFVLIIKSLGLDQPRAFIEYDADKDTNCLMLTLVPKFAMNPILSELIFIIDRSRSMNGSPIQKASSALELFLRSLPEDCYFNIVSFGDRFDPLFKQSEPNSPVSLSTALLFARNMTANYGGTEIYQVLKWIFDNKRTNLPTAVFLITDGNVWNVEEISELVRDNVKKYEDNLRIFALGVGSNVSSNLIESVARNGKGYAQFISDTERMDKKLLGMLKNCIKSPIKDYKITWTDDDNKLIEDTFKDSDQQNKDKPVISFFGEEETSSSKQTSNNDFVDNLAIRQAPYEIPQIYSGIRLVVYCMLAKGVTARKSIILSAMSQDGPMKLEIPVDPIILKGSKVHTLAARKLIQNLEDGTSYIHHHPKFCDKPVPASIIRKTIVTLGKAFDLTSKYTSFLAIDEREEMDEAKAKEKIDKIIWFKRNPLWGFPLNNPPVFGTNINNTSVQTTIQQPLFGFGAVTRPSLFGAPSQTSAFGRFGLASSQPLRFGFGSVTTQVSPFGHAMSQPGFYDGSQTQPSFGFSQTQPTFGGLGFAQTQAQPASGFGIAQTQPNYGGFNLPQPTFCGFGFSQTQAKTQTQPTFGGFGFAQTQAPTQPAFGGFCFAQTQAPTQPAFGGFGFAQTQSPAQPAFGGFGFAQTQTNYGGFNSAQTHPTFGSAQAQTHFNFRGLSSAQTQPTFGFAQAQTQPNYGLAQITTTQVQTQPAFGFAQLQPAFGSTRAQPTFDLEQAQDNFGKLSLVQTQTNYGFGFTQPQPRFGTFNLPQSQPTLVSLNLTQSQPVLGSLDGSLENSQRSTYKSTQSILPFGGFNIPSPALSLFDLNTTSSASSLFASLSTSPNLRIDDKKFDPKNSSFDILMTFLKFQSFDGIFKPTSQFYSFFGDINPVINKPLEYNDESWCTSISIAYLEIVMWKNLKDESEMCYEKANRALKKLMENDTKVNAILEKARNWINDWLSDQHK